MVPFAKQLYVHPGSQSCFERQKDCPAHAGAAHGTKAASVTTW
jgi:hypothetical protein